MTSKFRKWITLIPMLGLLIIFGVAHSALAEQTLVVGRGSDANSLDPAEATSFEAIKCADWSFDGLVKFDGNSHKIVPALAESWKISDDGLTWTFKLKKGVKFHDGTPVNADAVVFSFERQRDKSNPYWDKRFARWSAKFGSVKLTEKVDDYTVNIHLNSPAPALLVNLTLYIGHIVSPTAVKKDKDTFRQNPVGTGYFKFVKWVKDGYIEYEANKDYWDGAPKVDRLIVKIIPDNEVRLLALKKGEIHFAYGIPYPHFQEIEKSQDLKLYTTTTLGLSYLAMNVEKKPFDNLKVRQAVNHAINKDRLFKTVFYGYGDVANQTIPPSWWGHNKDVPQVEYSPEKAKKLLAEAGYPDGFTTDLISWTNPRPYCPGPRDMVTLVKSDLEKIGIKVNIKMMRWKSFRDLRGKGHYQMTMGGWISGTLDPDGILYALFHSRYARKENSLNLARIKDPAIDKLLQDARSTYDHKERDKLYQQAAMEIYKASPDIFVVHPVAAIAARANVKNIFIHDSHWVPLHNVSIE